MVTSIVLYIKNYTLIKFLWILVASLIVFYIIGRLFVNVIERFDQENVEADEQTDSEDEDGAVIEKEAGP